MKRFALIAMFVAAALALGGCEEENRTYLPDSHWILHVDGTAEGHRLALTFNGETMHVHDANWKTPPFGGSSSWDYYITDDGYLHIYYSTTDSDGYTDTYYYDLAMTLSDDGLTLTLVYKPWSGSARTYRFDRR